MLRSVNAGSQADEAVDGHADQEIDKGAHIRLKSLVLQRFGQVRPKRFIVNRVAKEDGDEIFEPSPRGCAEDFLRIRQGPEPPGERGDRPQRRA